MLNTALFYDTVKQEIATNFIPTNFIPIAMLADTGLP